MGTAQSLSFLTIAFSFHLAFFFDLDEGLSFGEIEQTRIDYISQNDLEFNFNFPSNWTIINSTHKDNGVITLTSTNSYVLFGEKMTFGMEKLQSNLSFQEYSSKELKILSTTLQEFHLVDSNPYLLSHRIWERIPFTHETNNRIIKVLQFWTLKDDNVYIIYFGTTSDSYSSYIPTIYKIISRVENFTKKLNRFPRVT